MVTSGVELHKLAMQICDILVGDPGGREVAVQLPDARMIERLSAMGVDGIITNDPRLFEQA